MRSESTRSPSFANTSTLERSTNTWSFTLRTLFEPGRVAPGKVLAERNFAGMCTINECLAMSGVETYESLGILSLAQAEANLAGLVRLQLSFEFVNFALESGLPNLPVDFSDAGILNAQPLVP